MTWDSLLVGYNPYADFVAFYEDFVSSTVSSDFVQTMFIDTIGASDEFVEFIFQSFVITLVYVVIFSLGFNFLAPIFRKSARW